MWKKFATSLSNISTIYQTNNNWLNLLTECLFSVTVGSCNWGWNMSLLSNICTLTWICSASGCSNNRLRGKPELQLWTGFKTTLVLSCRLYNIELLIYEWFFTELRITDNQQMFRISIYGLETCDLFAVDCTSLTIDIPAARLDLQVLITSDKTWAVFIT